MKNNIDIVYTWVDGSDQKWLTKKRNLQNKLFQNNSQLEAFSTVNGRFRDNQELKYSLRALDTFFPEHGNIFIVTDHQFPSYLKSEKINIIFHDQIMNYLPTFSSKKIESNLFKIPNISEQFLYFNDDVFLGPKFSLEDYYSFDTPFILYEEFNQFSEQESHINAIDVSKKFLLEKYPQHIFLQQAMSHSPKFVSKSLFQQFIDEFPDIYQLCQKEIFRENHIPSLLSDSFYRWLELKNLGLKKNLPSKYYQTKTKIKEQKILQLVKDFSDLHYFCINDTSDDDDNDYNFIILKEILEFLFPKKSRYEK
jgi:hypothetical protein